MATTTRTTSGAPFGDSAEEAARPERRVLSPAQEERRACVAPLFAYCAEHCLGPLWLARRASAHAGAPPMTKLRLSRIKNGLGANIPDWFIAGMCREIGQPVEVVMGREWAQRHMPNMPMLPGEQSGQSGQAEGSAGMRSETREKKAS